VDTTTNKTITLTTVSGGYRAMINTITFVVAAGDCEHDWVTEQTKSPDCTNAGENTLTCSLCGESKTETVNALGHDWEIISEEEATCTADGSTTYECAACGEDKVETIPALPHNYVDGVCAVCGEVQPLEVTIETFANTGVLDGSTSISWTNGDFSVVNQKGSSSTAIRTSDADHFRLYVGNTFTVSGGAMTKVVINCVSGYPVNDSTNKVNDGWTVTANGTAITYTATNGSADELTITIGKQSRVESVVITPYVEAPSDCEHDYVGVETQAPTCSAEGVMTYTCSKCGESYTEAIATIPHNYVEDIIDSTCTATGTKTYECSVCFDSYDEVIPVKPHNYVDDVCADCGAVKAYKGTITFDEEKTQRVEFTTQIQIWENEGLNVTNNKASSTTNVGDYSGRFYKNSEIIISFPEMAKLIIDATGVDNDKLWDDTLTNAGLSFTVENKIYTITFAEPVNSIELTCANQVRANSITAIVAHECVWTDATCTEPATCSKCGATEGKALGHSYDNDFDANCNVCGEIRVVDSPISYIAKSVSEDVNGYAVLFQADVEGIAVKAGTFVQADFTNATYNGYKLVGLGVKASNGVSETTIEGLRMYDLADGVAKFAFRIINIPADKLDAAITFTPYFVVEIDGVETTIYGEAVTASYNSVMSTVVLD